MMKYTIPLVLAVACSVVAASLTAAEAPPGWKTYPSPSGECEIAFPSKPTEQKESLEGLDGSGKVDQTQFLVGQPNGAYLMSHQPAPRLASADAKTVSDALDQARDRLAAVYAGKVLSTKDSMLGTVTGKEVVIDCPNIKGMIRSRMYLATGRFYQIMVIGEKEFITTKEADHFLGSFKLTR